jgi:hypothetical protein
MANSSSVQVLIDGPRNVSIKYEGVLDSGDLAYAVILDPATLAGLDNTGTLKAKNFRIERVQYSIEDNLSVNLFWDAATPKRIEELVGRGCQKYESFGGLVNNATSPSGKIGASTEGAAAGSILSFTVLISLIKTQ